MTPRELRREFADHLRLELADLGWVESVYPFDLFPDFESRAGHHLTYAIGVTQAVALPGNQRRHNAMMTTVGVRWAYTIRPRQLLESYDEALDREMEIVRALAGIKDASGQQPFAVQTIIRNIVEESQGGLFLGEIEGQVPHPVCLS